MRTIERCDRNKEANLSNRFQGDAKRVLCLCSASLLRSPSISNVLHREYGYNCRSAGVDLEYALTNISMALIIWADEIVCAENSHKEMVIEYIKEIYGNRGAEEYLDTKPIICLNIADRYGYMETELQELIITKYKEADTMSALQEKINKDLNIRD